ncbi:uncharacterized protein BDR25DRAFT_207768 [Lindgomyces ingoldianus]|uniref:Uncharacterized protein n=1 Tax=Lindgomyces ingoldianus TaxID=673940 RepID=A0ACB6RE99_9PLEO|nr:uncharacterized protein BDR25DRAFT_207768 [Lindgomyces ingoldianus]KAF2477648.1 hypothetical protein BDR25DRAFT_207768 [Lindgomyces ingoldianus]
MAIPYAELPLIVKDWIVAHPYQTALHVVNGMVFLTPAAATVPFFNMLGFTAAGPAGGSAASGLMSFFGIVPAGGVYATAQSAAMGGFGASVAAGAAQVGAVASSALGYIWGRQG